jgi:hypothetical protein
MLKILYKILFLLTFSSTSHFAFCQTDESFLDTWKGNADSAIFNMKNFLVNQGFDTASVHYLPIYLLKDTTDKSFSAPKKESVTVQVLFVSKSKMKIVGAGFLCQPYDAYYHFEERNLSVFGNMPCRMEHRKPTLPESYYRPINKLLKREEVSNFYMDRSENLFYRDKLNRIQVIRNRKE